MGALELPKQAIKRKNLTKTMEIQPRRRGHLSPNAANASTKQADAAPGDAGESTDPAGQRWCRQCLPAGDAGESADPDGQGKQALPAGRRPNIP